MSPSKWHQRSNRENPVSKIKFEKEIKRTRREKKRCHPAQEENSVTRKKTTTKNSVTSELEWRAKMGSNVGSPNGNPPPTVHQKKLINKKIIKKWKKKQTKKDKKKTRTSAKVSRPLGAALCLSLSLSLSLSLHLAISFPCGALFILQFAFVSSIFHGHIHKTKKNPSNAQ